MRLNSPYIFHSIRSSHNGMYMYAHKYNKIWRQIGIVWSVERRAMGCGVSKLSACSIYVVARTMMNRVFLLKNRIRKYVGLCKIMFMKYVIDLVDFYILGNTFLQFIYLYGILRRRSVYGNETFARFLFLQLRFSNNSNKQIIQSKFNSASLINELSLFFLIYLLLHK